MHFANLDNTYTVVEQLICFVFHSSVDGETATIASTPEAAAESESTTVQPDNNETATDGKCFPTARHDI